MTVLARARVILEGDASRLNRVFGGAIAGMERTGQRLTSIGRSLSLRVTAPLVGIATAASKMGADFEAEMAKIVGLVGVAQDQVDEWGRDILDLAPQLGRAPRELAEGLFFVTSAGFRGAEAMAILESSARAATAGLGDTATIADAVTSAVNAYGAESLSAAKATDILTAAVREGKLEAQSIAPVLGNLLPTASAMGIEFEQVAGMLAVFSRTGTDAAVGATSLLNVMVTLQKPTKGARDALEEAGFSMRQLRDMAAGPGGLVNVMRALEEAFADNDDGLAQIFPNIRAFRGVMNALAQDGAVVDGILQGVANSTGAADAAFESAAGTARFQFNAALARMQTGLIRLGDAILPTVTKLVEGVSRVVDKLARSFEAMDPGMQQIIVGMAALAAVVGPGALLLGGLVQLTLALKGITFLLPTLSLAMGPTGWMVLGLGVLATALVLFVDRQMKATRELREWNDQIQRMENVARGMDQSMLEQQFESLGLALQKNRAELRELEEQLEVFDSGAFRDLGIPLTEAQREAARLKEEIKSKTQVVGLLEARLRGVTDQWALMRTTAGTAVEAAEGMADPVREMEEALEATLAVTLGNVEATQVWQAGLRELPASMNEVLMASNQLNQGVRDSADGFNALGAVGASTANQMSNAVADFATGASGAFKRFVDFAIQQLARLAAKMVIFKALSAIFPGAGFVGSFGRQLGFAGAFATGGRIPAGQFGLVAEAGRPEVISRPSFVRGPAQVTPMQEGGASLNLTVNVEPARDLITMTRDRQWRRAIDESLADARDRGVLD